MRRTVPVGVRAIVVPALACSIVCGGAVAALAAAGVRALTPPVPPTAAQAPAPLAPPRPVVVRPAPDPTPTQAPTGTVWVVAYRG